MNQKHQRMPEQIAFEYRDRTQPSSTVSPHREADMRTGGRRLSHINRYNAPDARQRNVHTPEVMAQPMTWSDHQRNRAVGTGWSSAHLRIRGYLPPRDRYVSSARSRSRLCVQRYRCAVGGVCVKRASGDASWECLRCLCWLSWPSVLPCSVQIFMCDR